ncbi:MAG: DUF3575 domain-containing protein [Muribaculaceae bacterium]|nr:DUF3575 domain-containing protein [Muribaculaceae bacterium]
MLSFPIKYKLRCLTLFSIVLSFPMFAQNVAVKTNLLSDAALTPSLGLEIGLAKKWTIDIDGQVNFWPVDGHKWEHMLIQPEARYWFCRKFAGHFIGINAIGAQYNVGNLDLGGLHFLGTDFRNLKDLRYQGWAAGAGIAYGYSWPVHAHWNIEAELGLGWLYTRYTSYPCAKCGNKIRNRHPHNYAGPTKAAINIVYIFK